MSISVDVSISFMFCVTGSAHARLVQLSLVVVTTLCAGESVYFTPLDSVGAVYDSWVVTFTLDISPYQEHLDSIRKLVKQYEQAFHYLAHDSRAVSSERYSGILNLLGKETEKFKDDYYDLFESLEETKGLVAAKVKPGTVSKRAILPFVGTLLSTLFGTATTGELSKLKQGLSSLASSETQLRSVVRESLLLINKTHEAVRENRDVIIQLRNATENFHTEIATVYRKLSNIDTEVSYVEMVTKIHDAFHVVSYALKETRRSLTELTWQISDAIHGKLSMLLVKPSELLKLLIKIQGNLEGGASLPFPLTYSEVYKYYQYLQPLMLPDGERFHVVIVLPLVHSHSKFRMYTVISIPTPNEDLGVSLSYKLEADHVLISENATYYSLIQSTDINQCKSLQQCRFNAPWFKVDGYPSCVMAHYLERQDDIDKYCTLEASRLGGLPVLYKLYDSYWVVVTLKDFSLHITCKKGSPRLIKQQVVSGMHMIVLNPHCSTDSKYFHIPRFASGKSSKELIAKFGMEVGLSKLSESIWNTTHPQLNKLVLYNSSKVANIPELEYLPKMPVAKLLSRLEDVSPKAELLDNQEVLRSHSTWVIVFAIILVIVLTSVTLALVCYCKVKGFSICKRTHGYAVAGVEEKDEAKAEESEPIRHQSPSSEEPHTSVLFLKNQ